MELKSKYFKTSDIMELLLGDTMDTATMQLADPALLRYYQQISRRELLLDTDVDGDVNSLIHWIRYWNQEDRDNAIPVQQRRPITLLLDTPGGETMEGLALYSAMKASKTPIRAIVMGTCASAGMIILSGATPGMRYAFDTSSFLIHDGSCGVYDSSNKSQDTMKYWKMLDEKVRSCIVENSKISPALYKKKERIEWWMMAQEALKYGLIDHIVTDFDDIADVAHE